MRPCCPPGHGCNADGGAESCALELCRAATDRQKDAALALRRWSSLVAARDRGRGEREFRFRRRAFERARDRALIALALETDAPDPSRAGRRGRRRRGYGRRRTVAG